MTTYADHEIEFWADVFQACRLAGEGVRFEAFMASPRAMLKAFGMEDALDVMASGYLPLLPKQARVRERLDAVRECRPIAGDGQTPCEMTLSSAQYLVAA